MVREPAEALRPAVLFPFRLSPVLQFRAVSWQFELSWEVISNTSRALLMPLEADRVVAFEEFFTHPVAACKIPSINDFECHVWDWYVIR